MGYDSAVLRRAAARMEQSRKDREEALQRRRKEIFTQLPEAADIDRQIRGTCMDIIRSSFLTRRDPAPALAAIRDKAAMDSPWLPVVIRTIWSSV